MTKKRPQQIRFKKIKHGVWWGVAPCGLAYRIARAGISEGRMLWTLEEFPNEDAEIGEYVDQGPIRDLKRRAELEAECHDKNRAECA